MTSLTTTRWFLIAWFKILFLEETETIIKPQFGDLGFHVSDSFGPIVLFLTELVKNYGIVISGGLNKRQLEVGLGFPARVWAGSQQWKHQILATRPVVSDKDPGPLALQKRIPQNWKVMKQVKYLLRKKKRVQYMWIDTRVNSGRKSHWVALSWQVELLLWGISSGFPLANHFN